MSVTAHSVRQCSGNVPYAMTNYASRADTSFGNRLGGAEAHEPDRGAERRAK